MAALRKDAASHDHPHMYLTVKMAFKLNLNTVQSANDVTGFPDHPHGY
jgi:hypothetical protein